MAARIRLVASLICRNEVGRYLEPCVDHLLEFCDAIAVMDDGSDDGSAEWLARRFQGDDRCYLLPFADDQFFTNEGRARQALLDFTLGLDPTHVIPVDCDEFVTDGATLRRTIENADARQAVWSVCLMEVWGADADGLRIRQDGGWVEHDVPIVYAPGRLSGLLQIPDRALASGRTPTATRGPRASHTGTGILHWGWANVAERAARYQRYVDHDGGRFHAGSHIESIMLPDERVTLNEWGWPPALLPYRDAILAHAGVTG